MRTQKQIIMSKAWEIRKEAAIEQDVKVSNVHFGTCMKMAWAMMKKYGYEMFGMVEAVMEIVKAEEADHFRTSTCILVDSKIWDMKEISARDSKWVGIEYNYHFA